MLWLAAHLPRLAVEIHALPPPAAAVAQGRVVAADATAEALGVLPGMRLASALGLAPGLGVCVPEARRQQLTLEALACWAGHFTSRVSLAPPDEMLLEIGGSLRLFGGQHNILERFTAGCAAQGLSIRPGLAPTPLAAQWLARAGDEEHIASDPPEPGDRQGLAALLAPLPVDVLRLDARARDSLRAFGLDTLGQLFALPAAALANRLGPQLPLQLAQALGDAPDLRPVFVFPERFSLHLELPARVEQAGMLLFAANRLLLALGGWLQVRAAGIRECVLHLLHDGEPATRVPLRFATATRDTERLQRVLRERLERLPLAAPVVELRLDADAVETLPGRTDVLFGSAGSAHIAPVVERLRARLGHDAVHGLAAVAEHRPECATRAVDWPHDDTACVTAPPRPLCLLPAPLALAERGDAPHHAGRRLTLLTRAERIESGWWDGGEGPGDVRRDYFVALSPDGAWLWIFRDARGWWLHGHFD